MNRKITTLLCSAVLLSFSSCQNTEKGLSMNSVALIGSKKTKSEEVRNLSQEFKDYWYAGEAEITSYALKQERYGELREGTAVTVFVTEDFVPEKQVKANRTSDANIPVLKQNSTKKFRTGIYPYSIMTSTFSPVKSTGHAIKVANSVQEWCGQVYMQINNREAYEFMGHSYFESEGDQKLTLPKTWLEDELWSLVRINPEELPTGDLLILPSMESLRLRHKEVRAYEAVASLKQGDSLTTYEVRYPNLKRDLLIYFNSTFPFEIEKWEETNAGWGNKSERLKTSGTRMKRIKSAYWTKNRNSDEYLRENLGLKP
ncbi:MAG: septum formation inhibitor Maf [Bacteroidia bacterium]|nr:septum formation inhibitor Maf [Bacteroidia bacterium]MBT8276582.1 septum formation inhibitor Maf [Bacteroidia bacterium]NNF31342.1 septum formation inhibitor Maf [Flavobacteriaceae bacterium]NNJ82553.1 septum formation inhibitor Maf [Flavobacteriaceae bacterium]NNK54384.1 septum formation inhibitor Maf [Flavobacteriaceae bacterium]